MYYNIRYNVMQEGYKIFVSFKEFFKKNRQGTVKLISNLMEYYYITLPIPM